MLQRGFTCIAPAGINACSEGPQPAAALCCAALCCAGPVILVVDCPSEAFVPALIASPDLAKWTTPEHKDKGQGWAMRGVE